MSNSTYKVGLKFSADSKQAEDSVGRLGDGLGQLDSKTESAARSNKAFSGSGSGVISFLTKGTVVATAAVAAIAGVGFALADLGIDTVRAGAELAKLSESLNMSAESLSAWQYAGQQTFGDAEKIADIFKDMNDRVGDFASTGAGPLADVMRVTNLEIRDLINLSPDEQLLKVYDALEQIDGISKAEKTFYLEALAGDASKLIPLLEDDAKKLRELQAEARMLGLVTSDIDAERLAIVNTELNKVGGIAKGAANQLGTALAPAVYGVTKEISDAVLAMGGFGDVSEDVVSAILTGAGWVANGYQRIEKGVKLIEVGMLFMGEKGVGALAAMGDSGAELVNAVLSPLQWVIGNITELWSGLLGGAAKIGGDLNPFADDFQNASDALSGWSEKVKEFKVDASDIAGVHDDLTVRLGKAKDELIALGKEPPYSDQLKGWYDGNKQSLQEQAEAVLKLKSANTQTGRATHLLGKDVEESTEANKKLTDEQRLALQVIESTLTPLEVLNQKKKTYNKLLKSGLISQTVANRALAEAGEEFKRNDKLYLENKKTKEEAAANFKKLQDEGAAALSRIRTKLEVFNDTKDRYKVLLDAAAISQDDYNKLVAKATIEYNKNSDAGVKKAKTDERLANAQKKLSEQFTSANNKVAVLRETLTKGAAAGRQLELRQASMHNSVMLLSAAEAKRLQGLEAEGVETEKQISKNNTADATYKRLIATANENTLRLTEGADAVRRKKLENEGLEQSEIDHVFALEASNEATERANEINKSFGDILRNDAQGAIKDLVDTGVPLLDKLINKFVDLVFESEAVSGLFDGAGGQSGGGIGGFLSGLFGGGSPGGASGGDNSGGGVGGFLASLFHTGGVPGIDAGSGVKALPKFHTGGIPGLENNERVIVTQLGEGVFTQGQMAAMAPVAPIVNMLSSNQGQSDTNIQIDYNPVFQIEGSQSGTDIELALAIPLQQLKSDLYKAVPNLVDNALNRGGRVSRSAGRRL